MGPIAAILSPSTASATSFCTASTVTTVVCEKTTVRPAPAAPVTPRGSSRSAAAPAPAPASSSRRLMAVEVCGARDGDGDCWLVEAGMAQTSVTPGTSQGVPYGCMA